MPSQEQLNHEKFTGEKIVSLIGEALRFDRFGDPQQMEPDLIFSDGCKVGIEVTTAYYHGDPDDPNFHARDEWQFARNPTFDEHGSIGPSTRQRGGRDFETAWTSDSRLPASFNYMKNAQSAMRVLTGSGLPFTP